jgi:hypothetical protein
MDRISATINPHAVLGAALSPARRTEGPQPLERVAIEDKRVDDAFGIRAGISLTAASAQHRADDPFRFSRACIALAGITGRR